MADYDDISISGLSLTLPSYDEAVVMTSLGGARASEVGVPGGYDVMGDDSGRRHSTLVGLENVDLERVDVGENRNDTVVIVITDDDAGGGTEADGDEDAERRSSNCRSHRYTNVRSVCCY